MGEVTAFQKLCRAGLNNPDGFATRLRQFKIAIERAALSDDADFQGLCDALCAATQEEIERFERNMVDRSQKPDGPTRQTAEKIGKDPVVVLVQAGTLTKDDERTIQELLELRQKLSSGLTGSGGQIGERVDTSTKTFTHPVERLSKRQDLMLSHVYRPWVEAHQYNGVPVGKGRHLSISPFELVISVVEEGRTLGYFEAKFHVRKGLFAEPLINTIRDFAVKLARAEHEGKVPRVGE